MMNAVECLKACSQGSMTAADYAEACLSEIDKTDSRILAWQYLDRDQIAKDAEQADHTPSDLPLRGVPVGIKDIIDTSDAPCEFGSAVYTGRRPDADAGPASYCQVCAFKPTRTAIDKAGILQTSETLDQVGFFAASVPDLVLLSSVLVGTAPPDRRAGS